MLAELFLHQQPPLDVGYGGPEILQPASLQSLASVPQEDQEFSDALLKQVNLCNRANEKAIYNFMFGMSDLPLLGPLDLYLKI